MTQKINFISVYINLQNYRMYFRNKIDYKVIDTFNYCTEIVIQYN